MDGLMCFAFRKELLCIHIYIYICIAWEPCACDEGSSCLICPGRMNALMRQHLTWTTVDRTNKDLRTCPTCLCQLRYRACADGPQRLQSSTWKIKRKRPRLIPHLDSHCACHYLQITMHTSRIRDKFDKWKCIYTYIYRSLLYMYHLNHDKKAIS